MDSDKNFNAWTSTILRFVISKMEIKEELGDVLKKHLPKFILNGFKSSYFADPGYILKAHLKPKRLKATIVAPDDELKDYFEMMSNLTSKKNVLPLTTLSEAKKYFGDVGLENSVEFIPLSEQLIENYCLSLIESEIPKDWKPTLKEPK